MVHRNAFAGPGAERNLERRAPKSSLFPPRPNQTGLGWTRSQDRTPFAPHTAISEETPFCAESLPRGGPVETGFCGPGAFGRADAARFLPHRIAKAVKRTIHWMVRPPCLLTSPGRFAHFYGGQPYTARPPLSLRDISPTLWGNLPAPPQSLRSRFGRRLVCAQLAHGAL